MSDFERTRASDVTVEPEVTTGTARWRLFKFGGLVLSSVSGDYLFCSDSESPGPWGSDSEVLVVLVVRGTTQ